MKEKYHSEIPLWLRLLGAWRINRDSIDFKWGYFAPKFGFEFILNRGTYFDQRYAIHLSFIWGVFMIYLPFKTSLEAGCDMPRYGFSVHGNSFWIYTGGHYDNGQTQNGWIAWNLPFFTYEFDGHWIKDFNGHWVKVTRGWEFKESGHAYVESHPYIYKLTNGKIQNRIATCTIEKRQWHRKWFPFLTMNSQVIDIDFNEEVGERTGTWKGGTTGCSYELLANETIKDCLLRMQSERKFN